jgi:23S rRNA (adenine2503-C2)-methyltransferase
MADVKIPLLGKTLSEIQGIVHGLGMPGFTAKQIVAWLYDKKVFSIDDMTNLSLKNRERLKENYEIGVTAPIHEMRSVDGTVKYLFCTPEGDYIESVYIPDEDRATLCVSSQVGCKMNCKFCMTGKQGYTNSLTPTQILNQIYSIPERDKLTNIVFMGMGEPFDNLDAVLRSLEILTADYRQTLLQLLHEHLHGQLSYAIQTGHPLHHFSFPIVHGPQKHNLPLLLYF